jgi:putative component of toxin-antitoxin plasmid stabilization module
MLTIEYFTDIDGKVIFDEWLDHLSDKQAIARITTRIARLKRGVFGDCKPYKMVYGNYVLTTEQAIACIIV